MVQLPTRRTCGRHLDDADAVDIGIRVQLREQIWEAVDTHVLDSVSLADALKVHVLRRAEDALKASPQSRAARLQRLENTATGIIGHHDGEVFRPRLQRPNCQRCGVVLERQVTHKCNRPRRADLVGMLAVGRQRNTDCRRHRAVDARGTSSRIRVHTRERQARVRRIAHRVRRAQHHVVTRAQAIRQRRRHMKSGQRFLRFNRLGKRLSHGLHRQLAGGLTDFRPLRVLLPHSLHMPNDGPCVRRHIRELHPKTVVFRFGDNGQLDIRIGQQLRDTSVQRRPAD